MFLLERRDVNSNTPATVTRRPPRMASTLARLRTDWFSFEEVIVRRARLKSNRF